MINKVGTGHTNSNRTNLPKQQCLFKTLWKHKFSHGGVLRNHRRGRGQRPLSSKEPLHLVFKVNRERLRHRSLRSHQSFSLIQQIVKKYAHRFGVKVEQISIQGDHCHLLIRAPRRSRYQHFFRVVAGQVAQRFQREGLLFGLRTGLRVELSVKRVTGTPRVRIAEKKRKGTRLWKHRPFTRVVRGFRAYRIVRDYIQLNEQEARGKIRYQKLRLRGLSSSDWALLWT